LFCQAKNFPADLLMLRDDDIPELVNEGSCDLGIVGLNVLTEKELEHKARGRDWEIEQVAALGFGTCRLALAAPKESGLKSIGGMKGRKIATSYPETVEAWLKRKKVKADVVTMSGAIEIAPRLQIADAICDLVSTGETLAANGLRELETVLESQSVLVRRTNHMPKSKEKMIDLLLRRINGVLRAEESKYIMLHAPVKRLEQVKAAIPGAKSPTIVPLQGVKDVVAVHAVCNENVFWETMEQLKKAGASAILVLPIEKMLE
jgi:ATP phosphoribosyltransferase